MCLSTGCVVLIFAVILINNTTISITCTSTTKNTTSLTT